VRCGAMKGKEGEQTGCGMLRVWGVDLIGGGKGWVGWFVYGREGWGLCKGARDGREWLFLEMIKLGSGSMDFSARINPHAPSLWYRKF